MMEVWKAAAHVAIALDALGVAMTCVLLILNSMILHHVCKVCHLQSLQGFIWDIFGYINS